MSRRSYEHLDDFERSDRRFQDEEDHRDRSFFDDIRDGLVHFLTSTDEHWPITIGFNELGALVICTGQPDQVGETGIIERVQYGDWIPYEWIDEEIEELRHEVLPNRGLLGGTLVLEETCEMRIAMQD